MRLLSVLSIPVGVLVAYVGGWNPFTAWNLLPVMAVLAGSLAFSRVGRERGRLRRVAIAFSVGVLAVVALTHLAWLFDWGGTATGSSTGGLIFIFIPFWAGIVGIFTAAGFLLADRLFGQTDAS